MFFPSLAKFILICFLMRKILKVYFLYMLNKTIDSLSLTLLVIFFYVEVGTDVCILRNCVSDLVELEVNIKN